MPPKRMTTEQRRHSIVQAAMPLFARKGFAATTTRELAAGAGVSEALLYRHFPGKEAIYQEILDNIGAEVDPFLTQVRNLEASAATLVRIVYSLAHRFIMGPGQGVFHWDTRHRLLAQSHLEDGGFASLVFRKIIHSAAPIFERCLAAAEGVGDLVASPIPPTIRFLFVHQFTSVIALARLPKTGLPYQVPDEELLHDAVWFMLRGLGLTDKAIRENFPLPSVDPLVNLP